MDIIKDLNDLLSKWQIDEAICLIASVKMTDQYTAEVQSFEKAVALLIEARKNLAKGRAIATGVGAFAAIVRISGVSRQILLRRRKEKDSIIYDKDLSGKWELIGGGVDVDDFVPGKDGYFGTITTTIRRETREEAGLNLYCWNFDGVAYKATLAKSDEKQSLFDDAFSVLIRWRDDFETIEFSSMIEKGELCFVPVESLSRIEITSPRMRSLIMQAIAGWENPCEYQSGH